MAKATLQEARRFVRNMRQQIERRRLKFVFCTNDKRRSGLYGDMMDKLIEFEGGLKKMGFRTTDEDEPGRVGRVVPRTKEWAEWRKAKDALFQEEMKRFLGR